MTSPQGVGGPGGAPGPGKSLRPHPRWFVVLCILFALWMAALLILYFSTVYPRRHPPNPPATSVHS